MTLSLAYGGLILGVVAWFILARKMSARSWEASPLPEGPSASEDNRPQTAKVGLWVFLGVITSLFSLFISAYYMRMGQGHGALQDWQALSEPKVLWLNTFVLLASSMVMQWARSCVRRGYKKQTRDGLLLGALLTLAFIAGQLYAWRLVVPAATDGWFLRDPALSFFYLLTAVHGLHLLGGLYVCGRTLLRLQTQALEAIDVRLSVELCTTYWHYLLLVWLVLFGLLLST
ncbi:MAG TPA: cytochrome c oxidase subunit 3 [Steroidobacteraceae bacterium]|nr:cytochrome c oxidase subunit 3 [Steroidobacteraceae bacterium]